MPSTYTTNNGLEKIGTGEQSGTWGDTTNLNFDIVDQALDGLVTVTATDTGSSGSPNTLPITDGSVSDGRNRLIIITDGGDLGGSVYYQLTPADAEKIVFLRNSLSGSQDLILFQGTYNAARDLIVPAGKDVIVKFSGTGTSTAVVAPVFADLSLDAATIASADINGGTIDGVTIGVTSVATVINVDNLKLDGNTLSSTDTNGNVVLAPNGDGDVQLDADTVRVGDSNNDVTITTNGTGDLTLNTNSGTDSGSIEIQDGANTNIIITADGTGKLELANGDITTSASSGSDAAGQDLTIQAGASTGNAAGGDMVFQTTPAGAGSGTNLNSYTTVLTLTDDSKMQIGTSTAVNSILDEDDMTSDSATALATQQSIKAYVDSQVGTVDTWSEVLANGNTSGATDAVITAGQKITTDTIDETTADAGVTIDSVLLKDDVVNATDIETSTISANDGTTAINIADSTGAVDIDTSLNVDGTATVDGLTSDGGITIDESGTAINITNGDGLTQLGKFHGESTDGFVIEGKANNNLTFRTKANTAGEGLKFQKSSGDNMVFIDGTTNDITFYDSTNASFVYDADAGTTINDNQDARDFTVKSDNNASMLYVDGTNDKVGVGLSSPNPTFHVKGPNTSGYGTMTIEGNADEVDPRLSLYGFSTTAGTTRAYVLDIFGDVSEKGARYDVPASYYQSWSVAGTKKMTLDSSGQLGIGGDPAQKLDLRANNNGAVEGNTLRFTDTDTATQSGQNSGTIEFYTSDTDGAGVHATIFAESTGTGGSGSIVAKSGAAGSLVENIRMRGDKTVINDGNADTDFQVKSVNQDDAIFVDAANDTVGFFTTDSAPADSASAEGTAVVGNGQLQVSKNGATPMKVNRIGTDGDLVRFQKNGSSGHFGSIGYLGGDFYVGSSAGSGAALRMDGTNDQIYPSNASGNARDGALNLGTSTVRFKDIYLSNAVVQNGVKATTTATTQVAIDTFAHASHDGAKVVITAATSADTYVTELLIATNGTTAVATEYGQIGTGSALATYDVDISGADVRILATPASTTSTTFRVAMTLT